jgi:hypothetical protein
MRKLVMVLTLGVLGGCAPTWDESCSSYCEWLWRCGGPSTIASVGACEAEFCSDGQDRYGPCWHEMWDWMDCVGGSTCSADAVAECRPLLGACDPDLWD